MIVKLVFQSYTKEMAIYIDDQPIGTISSLSRYQSQPFNAWCSVILPSLAEEVNDSYDLVYVGQESEYEVLKQFLPLCPSCRSIIYQAPVIADSTLVRLKKLSRIAQNGITVNRFTQILHIYTDLDHTIVQDALTAILPKLSFCRFSHSVEDLSQIHTAQNPTQSIAVIGGQSVSIKEIAVYASGIVAASEANPRVINTSLLLPLKNSSLADCIGRLLDLNIYPHILEKALTASNIPENSPYYPEYFMLDKIEPQTIVKLPSSIECGESIPIQIATLPKGSKTPQIKCRVSNDSVIQYDNGCLKAVGTGEAVIEVYEAGKTVTLKSGKITAYRRNRIKTLLIQPKEAKICVGEIMNIGFSFAPVDADNASAVRLLSKDGTVVSPRGNMSIIARSPGHCSVFYEAEKIKSDMCDIIVYPKLEKLEIIAADTLMRVNSMTKINVQRLPSEATLDKLLFSVEPSFLGTFDIGSGSFFARKAGKGKIVVRSDRSTVEASIPIEVKPASIIKGKGLLIGAIIAILALAAWFFLR